MRTTEDLVAELSALKQELGILRENLNGKNERIKSLKKQYFDKDTELITIQKTHATAFEGLKQEGDLLSSQMIEQKKIVDDTVKKIQDENKRLIALANKIKSTYEERKSLAIRHNASTNSREKAALRERIESIDQEIIRLIEKKEKLVSEIKLIQLRNATAYHTWEHAQKKLDLITQKLTHDRHAVDLSIAHLETSKTALHHECAREKAAAESLSLDIQQKEQRKSQIILALKELSASKPIYQKPNATFFSKNTKHEKLNKQKKQLAITYELMVNQLKEVPMFVCIAVKSPQFCTLAGVIAIGEALFKSEEIEKRKDVVDTYFKVAEIILFKQVKQLKDVTYGASLFVKDQLKAVIKLLKEEGEELEYSDDEQAHMGSSDFRTMTH